MYEKGAAFESVLIESKNSTKDEFYHLIIFPITGELHAPTEIKFLSLVYFLKETG